MADNTRKVAFGNALVQTDVDATNPLPVTTSNTAAAPLNVTVPTAVAVMTSVASSITSVVLLAANADRKGFIVYNDSTEVLYLNLEASASTTVFTAKVAVGGIFTMPSWPVRYTGAVSGIWPVAAGSARVTSVI